MIKHIFWLLPLLGLLSCAQRNNPTTATTEPTVQEEVTYTGKTFGAEVDPANAMTYDELLAKDNLADDARLTLIGTVDEVCQVKGCWMTMMPTNADDPHMRVTFKDYGFFMPKDISGKRVVMNGTLSRKVISVEEQRHYLEDAGESAEEIAKITEPSEELTYEADGVILLQD